MKLTDPVHKFEKKLHIMDDNLRQMGSMLRSNNIDITFDNCFNAIIDNATGFINYSRLRPRNFDNEILTWKKVQYSENYQDKFIFARNVFIIFLERFNIMKGNMDNIRLLVDLGNYLEIITNIDNLYFNLTEDEAIDKVFKSKSKTFNTIFKEDVKFLAYDYRKFSDINKFSEEESIEINREEGLKLYDIGELIYNFNLKDALDLLIKFKRFPIFV